MSVYQREQSLDQALKNRRSARSKLTHLDWPRARARAYVQNPFRVFERRKIYLVIVKDFQCFVLEIKPIAFLGVIWKNISCQSQHPAKR